MKKKIALALAAVMTFSALAPMNLFAAAETDVPQVIAGQGTNTLFVADGSEIPSNYKLNSGAFDKFNDLLNTIGSTTGKVKTSLNFQPKTKVINASPNEVTKQFEIKLENAEWALATVTSGSATDLVSTFDVTKYTNITYKDKYDNKTTDNFGFVDTMKYVQNTNSDEYGYTISTSSGDRSRITVSYTVPASDPTNPNVKNYIDVENFINIPLAIKTLGSGAVTASVSGENSFVGDINNIKISSSSTGTKNEAKVKEGNKNIVLNTISITENAEFAMATNNKAFYLEAPSGYKFTKFFGVDARGDAVNLTDVTADNFDNDNISAYFKDNVEDANTKPLKGNTTVSGRVLYVLLDDTGATPAEKGSKKAFFIKNLVLTTDDSEASYGETISITLGNAPDSAKITAGTLEVAKFVKAAISYSAATAKDFYAGFSQVNDTYKTAKITIQEETKNSWWVIQQTRFTLTDAEGNALPNDMIKIRAVKAKGTNFSTNIVEKTYNNFIKSDVDKPFAETAINDSDKAYFTKDGLTFVVQNLVAKPDEKAKMELEFYLSPDVNFEGPVYVKVSGTGISGDPDYVGNGGIVQIANIKPLVSIDTDVTEVQVGYQTIKVADVTITENKAGALSANPHAFTSGTQNGKVTLTVGEFGKATTDGDILFNPITQDNLEVVSGDIKVTVDKTTKAQAVIGLNIERTSRVASTIKLKNLEIKINRAVPYGKYELLVDGSSIRNNYTSDDVPVYNKDDSTKYYLSQFNNSGLVVENYVKVATEGVNTAFTTEIKIFADSADLIVNGEVKKMAVPSIAKENRLYVPLRFVSEVLGAKESDIVWDQLTQSATISLNGQKATWYLDSEYYIASNGARLGMAENGVTAKAFGYEERIYIPYRFLAYAFNIPVQYDAATGAAIYNPGNNK